MGDFHGIVENPHNHWLGLAFKKNSSMGGMRQCDRGFFWLDGLDAMVDLSEKTNSISSKTAPREGKLLRDTYIYIIIWDIYI